MKEDEVAGRGLTYHVAKYLALMGDMLLSDVHVEGTARLRKLKRMSDGKAMLFYTSLHKSLWETSGIPTALYRAGLPVPYPCMGDNLVKGETAQKWARRLGLFIIKRPTASDRLESRRSLIKGLEAHLEAKKDILIFPEGSRTCIVKNGEHGVFYSTCFGQAQLFQKSHIIASGEQKPVADPELYIVPVNVDYSKVKDARDMLRSVSQAKTMRPNDLFKVIFRQIGPVYISFGDPISVMDYLDLGQRDLASMTRQKCLDLVKILPVNITAQALLRSKTAVYGEVIGNIAEVRDMLSPHFDRFRGFTLMTGPEKIYGAGMADKLRKNIGLAKLYASYIGHYLRPTSS